MMKNFKRAISSFFTVAFAGVYMALNTTTAFAAMIDERPKTDDEVTAEALYVHTDNPEADAVFNAYVDMAVKMVGTDYYTTGIGSISVVDLVTSCGGTQEQLDQLRNNTAKIEQFLWCVTYTDLCSIIRYDIEKYERNTLDSWENLKQWIYEEVDGSRFIDFIKNARKKGADEATISEQQAAYETLMKWQYDYYTVNKSFYCFYTGQGLWLVNSMNDYSSYFGGETIAITTTTNQTSDSVITTTTTVSTSKLVPLTTTVSTTGIWEETGGKLAKTWLTLGIILVLLIALAVVVIIKKRKGY